MAQITGHIRIGEANAACPKIQTRQMGASRYVIWLVAVVLGGSSAILGEMLDTYFGEPFGFPTWIILLAVATPLYTITVRRLLIRRFQKKQTAKGTPLDMPMRMLLTPEGLVYELADVEHRAKWSAVSEVFFAKGYWIFLVQASAWFAPKRLFETDEASRAFLSEALSYMSEDARVRSKTAVKFAETGKL